jgi:putative Mg2+ transporter-C (MgtC) family protein
VDEFMRALAENDARIALRLLVAAILGGIVGFERHAADKPAGTRTMSLVSLGAALFTAVSIFGFSGTATDTSRVAAQIVTGIGFLGAGTIIQTRGGIAGLTTATSIWVSAAVGMAAGSGMYLTAAVATALTLVILRLLPRGL